MNKLPGGYVAMYAQAHPGLLHFYCPCFAAYAKLKEGNEYGRTLYCDECSINHHEEDRIEYETLWKCRRMSMYPAHPSKKIISDMFRFIAGTTDRQSLPRSRNKSCSAPSPGQVPDSCGGSSAIALPAIVPFLF